MFKIKEILSKALPQTEISEEFMTKLNASFETVIAQRVDEETKQLNKKISAYKRRLIEQKQLNKAYTAKRVKQVTEKAEKYADYVVEEMTKKVESYCNYVVENFVKKNKDRLIESAEYARMAKTLSTIRSVFESNYFQLNPIQGSKHLESQLKESNRAFNELFEEHRILKQQINEYSDYIQKENRKAIFNKLTENLSYTQKEKLKILSEKAKFDTIEEFEEGISLMIEEYNHQPNNKYISEEKETKTVSIDTNDKMKSYLENL